MNEVEPNIINIVLTIVAIISAAMAFISALIARSSAKASECSADAVCKSYTLNAEIAKVTLKIEPQFTPLPSKKDQKKFFDANILFHFENVGKEEGVLLQYNLFGFFIKTKIGKASIGRKTPFPLPAGQTFKCSILIPDIPKNIPLAEFGCVALILLIKFKGKYFSPKEIQIRRYEYAFNGRELYLLPDEQYKQIEQHLPEQFKRTDNNE